MNTPQTVVTPSFDGSAITLQFGVPSPFGAAELSCAGDGLVAFDPAAPDRLIAVSLVEPLAARDTLHAVVGRQAAQQVLDMHTDGEITGAITAEPTPALAPIARAALVNWVDQWAPLDIPKRAAQLDVGTAAHATGNALAAYDSFEESADFLLVLARAAVAGELPEPVVAEVRVVLAAAVESLGPGHELVTQLQEQLAALSATDAQVRGLDIQKILQDLRNETLVPVRGGPIDADLGDVASFDWAMVPARVLSHEEGALHLTRDDTGIQITARASKYVDRGELLGLSARLVDPDGGAMLAAAPLLLDRETGLFRADLPFDRYPDQAPDRLGRSAVEVYTVSPDGSVPAIRSETERQQAFAWRETVRLLSNVRRSRAAQVGLGQALELAATIAAAVRVAKYWPASAVGGERAAQGLRDWRAGLRGQPGEGAWPTGLPVPHAEWVGRPLLCELVEICAPQLFEQAQA